MTEKYIVTYEVDNGYTCGCCHTSWVEREEFQTKDEAMRFIAQKEVIQKIMDEKSFLEDIPYSSDFLNFTKERVNTLYSESNFSNFELFKTTEENEDFEKEKDKYLQEELIKLLDRTTPFYEKHTKSLEKKEDRDYQTYLKLKKKFEK